VQLHQFAARGPFLESPAVVLADCANPPTAVEAHERRTVILNRSESDELFYARELTARYEAQRAADELRTSWEVPSKALPYREGLPPRTSPPLHVLAVMAAQITPPIGSERS
jgi:hypothetical protein